MDSVRRTRGRSCTPRPARRNRCSSGHTRRSARRNRRSARRTRGSLGRPVDSEVAGSWTLSPFPAFGTFDRDPPTLPRPAGHSVALLGWSVGGVGKAAYHEGAGTPGGSGAPFAHEGLFA